MEDLEKLKEETKKKIQSLLISAPVGLTLQELKRDYNDFIGEAIPYYRCGYSSVEELLKDFPDVVIETCNNGVMCLKAVADDKTKHIAKLVSKQKLTKPHKWDTLSCKNSGGKKKRQRRRNKIPIISTSVRRQGLSLSAQKLKVLSRTPNKTKRSASFGKTKASDNSHKIETYHNCKKSKSPKPDLPQNVIGKDIVPHLRTPSSLRKKILLLMKAHPSGIPLNDFESVFYSKYNVRLNSSQLGFKRLRDLLYTMADVIKVVVQNKEWFVLPAKVILTNSAVKQKNKCVNLFEALQEEESRSAQEQDMAANPIPTEQHNDGSTELPNEQVKVFSESEIVEDLEKLIEETKKTIRSLLISAPVGLTLRELKRDYKKFIGEAIPYFRCGYSSVKELLRDCSDVVIETCNNGVMCLKAIADDKTKHIAKLVSKQTLIKPFKWDTLRYKHFGGIRKRKRRRNKISDISTSVRRQGLLLSAQKLKVVSRTPNKTKRLARFGKTKAYDNSHKIETDHLMSNDCTKSKSQKEEEMETNQIHTEQPNDGNTELQTEQIIDDNNDGTNDVFRPNLSEALTKNNLDHTNKDFGNDIKPKKEFFDIPAVLNVHSNIPRIENFETGRIEEVMCTEHVIVETFNQQSNTNQTAEFTNGNSDLIKSEPIEIVETGTDTETGPTAVIQLNAKKKSNRGTFRHAARCISQVKHEPIRPISPQSQARNAISRTLHIQNLSRPFTIDELKQLLQKTGSIVEEYLWVDMFRSECYVTYENLNEAVRTRQALHGARWPPCNKRKLDVEFYNSDEKECDIKDKKDDTLLDPQSIDNTNDNRQANRNRTKSRRKSLQSMKQQSLDTKIEAIQKQEKQNYRRIANSSASIDVIMDDVFIANVSFQPRDKKKRKIPSNKQGDNRITKIRKQSLKSLKKTRVSPHTETTPRERRPLFRTHGPSENKKTSYPLTPKLWKRASNRRLYSDDFEGTERHHTIVREGRVWISESEDNEDDTCPDRKLKSVVGYCYIKKGRKRGTMNSDDSARSKQKQQIITDTNGPNEGAEKRKKLERKGRKSSETEMIKKDKNIYKAGVGMKRHKEVRVFSFETPKSQRQLQRSCRELRSESFGGYLKAAQRISHEVYKDTRSGSFGRDLAARRTPHTDSFGRDLAARRTSHTDSFGRDLAARRTPQTDSFGRDLAARRTSHTDCTDSRSEGVDRHLKARRRTSQKDRKGSQSEQMKSSAKGTRRISRSERSKCVSKLKRNCSDSKEDLRKQDGSSNIYLTKPQTLKDRSKRKKDSSNSSKQPKDLNLTPMSKKLRLKSLKRPVMEARIESTPKRRRRNQSPQPIMPVYARNGHDSRRKKEWRDRKRYTRSCRSDVDFDWRQRRQPCHEDQNGRQGRYQQSHIDLNWREHSHLQLQTPNSISSSSHEQSGGKEHTQTNKPTKNAFGTEKATSNGRSPPLTRQVAQIVPFRPGLERNNEERSIQSETLSVEFKTSMIKTETNQMPESISNEHNRERKPTQLRIPSISTLSSAVAQKEIKSGYTQMCHICNIKIESIKEEFEHCNGSVHVYNYELLKATGRLSSRIS